MRVVRPILALLIAPLATSVPAAAQSPIPVVDGYVTEGFVGWSKIVSGLPAGVSYLYRPNNPALAGAFVWFEAIDTSSTTAAFQASARTHKITGMRILASSRVDQAVLLDAKGSGMTVMGEGVRNGRPVRMVAFVFYGSTNNTLRVSGVHGFVAPTPLYEALGGWTVPASQWMNLDPRREVRDARAQGTAAPAVQTLRFAGIANMWARLALNTMRGLAQGNIAAMSSARQTMVCAGDPQCRIVPVN